MSTAAAAAAADNIDVITVVDMQLWISVIVAICVIIVTLFAIREYILRMLRHSERVTADPSLHHEHTNVPIVSSSSVYDMLDSESAAAAAAAYGRDDHDMSFSGDGDDDDDAYLLNYQLFRSLDPTVVQCLVSKLTTQTFNENDVVFNEGSRTTAVYLVKSGIVRYEAACSDRNGHINSSNNSYCNSNSNNNSSHHRSSFVLGEAIRGDSLCSQLTMIQAMAGEMMLWPVTAVCAENNTELYVLSLDAFKLLTDEHPMAVHEASQLIIMRLQRVLLQTLCTYFGLSDHMMQLSRIGNVEATARFLTSRCDSTLALDQQKGRRRQSQGAMLLAHLLQLTSTEDLHFLETRARVTRLSPGDRIGGLGSNHMLACVLVGEFDVYTHSHAGENGARTPVKMFTAEPGAILGHVETLTQEDHFLAIATTAAEFVSISRLDFQELAEQCPLLTLTLSSNLVCMVSRLVWQFDMSLEWIHLEAGQPLYLQGDESDALYIVMHGRLRSTVHRSESGSQRQMSVEEHGRGESIGAAELIAAQLRRATVTPIRDSELCRITNRLIDFLGYHSPRLFMHFAAYSFNSYLMHSQPKDSPIVNAGNVDIHSLSKQTGVRFVSRRNVDGCGNTAGSSGHSPVSTVAVLPLSKDVPLSEFSERLTNSLEKIGPTILLDRTKVLEHFRTDSTRRICVAKLSCWLGQQEENGLVVYEANPDLSPHLTRVCVRQADVILLVGSVANGPVPGDLEQGYTELIKESNARKELVLLHFNERINGIESRPVHSSVRAWANQRSWTNGHYHVRIHMSDFDRDVSHFQSDFGRIARYLTGTAIGIVLGGGGAKGLAHCGVLEALETAQIPIDYIGGTSIGAFIGGLYAIYRDCAIVRRLVREYSLQFTNKWKIFADLTFPLTSYTSGHGFNRLIRMYFGDTMIEDTWLPFFCLTLNLTTSESTTHTQGVAWRYVRASMSLASFLPPICENSNLLVDGGYANNLPADVMRRVAYGVGKVIAVDVGKQRANEFTNYGDSLSGFWLLWKFLNPFVDCVNVPSMSELMSRLAYISCDVNKRNAHLDIDWYMRPPVNHYGLLAFPKFDQISAVGLDYATTHIREEREADRLSSYLLYKQPRLRRHSRKRSSSPSSP